MEAAVQTVRVRDIDMRVVRLGQGSPLLISGGPQLGHAYMRPLDVLADAHELVYYDARGVGDSQLGDASRLTLGDAVEDLAALRIAIGLSRWSILGHSLGGHVAYLYASRHPESVESLILVDTGPPLTREAGAELGRAMQAKRTPDDDAERDQIVASEAFAARDPMAIERFILNLYTPFFRSRATVATLRLGFTAMTAANVLDYEDLLVASLPHQDPAGSLARIGCPTLVLHGDADPIPVAFSRFLADRIADARLLVIPGGGHFPFIEEREPFERAVREFLSQAS